MKFVEAKKDKDLKDIYNHDFGVFADALDFKWTLEGIKKVKKAGWGVFSLVVEDEIIAALFIKFEKGVLYTKNTPIKINHQGHSYSDRIKDYYEKLAKKKNAKKIVHFCRVDDFRMISLNEDFGYKRTGNTLEDNDEFIEWEKIFKKDK